MIKILQFLVLFSISVLHAQMSNLTKLSTGKLIYFSPIYKREKVDSTMISVQKIWGYGLVYELEKVDNQINKFEYILLDRNLNKFANGEFNAVSYTHLDVYKRQICGFRIYGKSRKSNCEYCENCKKLVSSITVSYTHLDVYKRQLLV